MSIDPKTAFSLYSQAWDGKLDAAARAELLSQAWAEDGELFDPDTPDGLIGRVALGAYIQEQHEASPSWWSVRPPSRSCSGIVCGEGGPSMRAEF